MIRHSGSRGQPLNQAIQASASSPSPETQPWRDVQAAASDGGEEAASLWAGQSPLEVFPSGAGPVGRRGAAMRANRLAPPWHHRSQTQPLHQLRHHWSTQNSWHWPHDPQREEDSHRCREPNGIEIPATLHSLAMHALRLDGCGSIAGRAQHPGSRHQEFIGTTGLENTGPGNQLSMTSDWPWARGGSTVRVTGTVPQSA